ncbi:hypothetical protein SAMN05443287_1136 [Micromonospora phaseoli]|uniref:Uncharacterized protein n=1 Tax=Micromonospora phaseoli TaxID=1144548 RepID=A0A1H7DBZ1_9ACTN|nr:hypothetical protein [Micromonospora phaseoli]PZV90591.1 hypothetical protein CLV64_113131 [Micromonospora phaseoli]GIJ78017.1 hypothetical protein Xph01_24490 [Micromonospora phaseoli]SEJ99323.1 hypothetical protein SAMN05443287_1136 [Micromonospora phaseoli]
MPAPVPADPRHPQLLVVLFWGGAALAPVAALILLVADGNGPLRFAAVLAILAVVLIGLSIALRTESGGQAHAEELREEIDELRRELRGEIVAAAQRGNQALDEVQRAQAALAGLRRRVDSGGAGSTGSEEPPGPGRARVPVPEPEVPHAERPAGQAGVYGAGQPSGRGPEGGYAGERAPVYGGDRPPAHGGDRPASGAAGVYGSAARPEQDNRPGDPAPRPLGVVRHTETVHVTTRHTIMDGGVGESGNRYGGYPATWPAKQPEEHARGGHGPDRDDRAWSDGGDRPRRDGGRAWSGPAQHDERAWADAAVNDERAWSGSPRGEERSWPQPREERQWSGERDDWSAPRDDRSGHYDEPSVNRDDHDWGAPRDDRGWDGGAPQWEVPAEAAPVGRAHRVDDTGQYWAQLRAGDRWAAVRDDEQGRELRVGERRAELHADPSGTEYRVADRWASVRRDEHRGGNGDEARRDAWGEPESPPALPAGGVPVPPQWRPARQHGYQQEAVGGYQQEPAHGYQAEPVRGQRSGPEPYGRRHQAEEPDYGYPARDGGANRWR